MSSVPSRPGRCAAPPAGLLSRAPLLGLVGLLAGVVMAALVAPADPALGDDRAARRGLADGSSQSGDSLFPRMGNGGYDVRHYVLRLDYAPARRQLDGVATITATAQQALTSFSLDLAGLTVDTVRVDGHAATFGRRGHELRVEPVVPIKDSDRFTVVVRYGGRPTTWTDPDGSGEGWFTTSDGATTLNEPVGAMTWFPVNNTPSDTAFYDLVLTAPKDLQAVSNGHQLSRVVDGDQATTRWAMTRPMASHMAFVSFGRYRTFTGRLKNGPRLTSYTDSALGRFPAARTALPSVLRFLQARLGPYPFADAGIVVDRVSSGYALETQTRPTFPGGLDLPTLAHEMSHQWVGGALVPADWKDIWLNEGFATYFEWAWGAAHGGASLQRRLDRLYDEHGDGDAFWNLAPAELDDPARLFADAIYQRGAMTLVALRQTIGSAAFGTLMHRWVAQHRYGLVDTNEFTALASRVAGQDLDDFFDAWLHRAARPPRP